MKLVFVTFAQCENVTAHTKSAALMNPEEIITRGEKVCDAKGIIEPEFVRIDYHQERVEFLV